ncbi:MAG: hypothetical protein ACI9S8_002653 [Chlamydiales bacterium]|jgi:hypothetical protein
MIQAGDTNGKTSWPSFRDISKLFTKRQSTSKGDRKIISVSDKISPVTTRNPGPLSNHTFTPLMEVQPESEIGQRNLVSSIEHEPGFEESFIKTAVTIRACNLSPPIMDESNAEAKSMLGGAMKELKKHKTSMLYLSALTKLAPIADKKSKQGLKVLSLIAKLPAGESHHHVEKPSTVEHSAKATAGVINEAGFAKEVLSHPSGFTGIGAAIPPLMLAANAFELESSIDDLVHTNETFKEIENDTKADFADKSIIPEDLDKLIANKQAQKLTTNILQTISSSSGLTAGAILTTSLVIATPVCPPLVAGLCLASGVVGGVNLMIQCVEQGKDINETVELTADKAHKDLNQTGENIQRFLEEAKTNIGEFIEKPDEKTMDFVGETVSFLEGTGKSIKASLAETGRSAQDTLGQTGVTIERSLNEAGEEVDGILKRSGEDVKGILNQATEEIRINVDNFTPTLNKAGEDITFVLNTARGDIEKTLRQAEEGTKNLIKEAEDGAINLLEEASQNLSRQAGDLVSSFKFW